MKKNKLDIRQIAALGLLSAMTFIMINTVLGTITLGVVSITIAHIPIILATLMLGLKEGLLMAFIFGALTMAKAFTPMGILDVLFQNPLVSIAPRMLIPITTFFTYKLLSKFSNLTKTSVAAVVGSLTNTIFVALALYFVVGTQLEAIIGQDALTVVMSIITSAAIPEAIAIGLICTPIILRIRIYK